MPADLNSKQVGTLQTPRVNDPRPSHLTGKNEFPQSFHFLNTMRYGECSPYFALRVEKNDTMSLGGSHALRTYTLASPMLSGVTMKKHVVKVPMYALYPRNWDIMMPIPTKGDDVPDYMRCIFCPDVFVSALASLIDNIISSSDTGELNNVDFTRIVRAVFLIESVCSSGSLFAQLNLHFEHFAELWYDDERSGSFDKWFDLEFIPWLKAVIDYSDYGFIVSYRGRRYLYSSSVLASSYGHYNSDGIIYTSFPRMLEILRTGDFEVDESFSTDYSTGFVDSLFVPPIIGSGYYVNIENVIAYQLACAQFETNEHVDSVFSAQLFRDACESLYSACSVYFSGLSFNNTFEWNGITKLADVFSGYRLLPLVSLARVSFVSSNFDGFEAFADFFENLFLIRRSLRFGDYFTGARPLPLSVGESSAEVVNSEVQAVDITRSIQLQRLRNKANLVGSKISNYLKGLFGGALPEAPKDVPLYLYDESFGIGSIETDNTGSAQLDVSSNNTTTTMLRSGQSSRRYEVTFNEPAIVIGYVTFDVHRIYSRTVDRFAFHFDRYDDFIPELQFIGDQEIKLRELEASSGVDAIFAYTLRYMEYKLRNSYASGGWIENLPSWAMITDNSDGNEPGVVIDESYIRSSPSEFDRFYKSLTGWSLASRFHFICDFYNDLTMYRQMVVTPQILG